MSFLAAIELFNPSFREFLHQIFQGLFQTRDQAKAQAAAGIGIGKRLVVDHHGHPIEVVTLPRTPGHH